MNKLKSNLCCIYHKPGDSSSDTCTSDDEANALERDRETKKKHKEKCSKRKNKCQHGDKGCHQQHTKWSWNICQCFGFNILEFQDFRVKTVFADYFLESLKNSFVKRMKTNIQVKWSFNHGKPREELLCSIHSFASITMTLESHRCIVLGMFFSESKAVIWAWILE